MLLTLQVVFQEGEQEDAAKEELLLGHRLHQSHFLLSEVALSPSRNPAFLRRWLLAVPFPSLRRESF